MDISLEKIDIIRERTGVSYKTAKEALELNDGNVVDALIYLEENQKSWTENITNKSDEVIEALKEALRKGNVTKITVKKDGEVLMNIPVTAGAIGAILSPPVTAVGVTAALLSKCTIEIVKENGEVVNINEMAGKTVDKVRKTVRMDNNKTNDSYNQQSNQESNNE
ncbi:DUF4342 domain-containing protein [Caldisalinibacter kiritimatiensis]|uniref:N-terminal of elongation factor Ts n=1 Tax=Caldisalinibacter kiritimatiensis TaxID=1304284 RepID=R1ARW1_9FIRM|nr:DUF4342 domain-containing protein [Caldisalinibacter kiritimatiensis]EOC99882.1 N-terminal of elongation factor Ts [Caldisalinibacter kiritimatiensis]